MGPTDSAVAVAGTVISVTNMRDGRWRAVVFV
jgi:hypothetical protein